MPLGARERTRDTVLTLLALGAWLGATLALRALALPDEGRYAGVAWEMLRSGRWLEPTLDGLPFLHKPPLWYWLSAASMSTFGVHPWAARLPSLFGALVAGASLFLFVRRRVDARAARTALMAYATLPLVYVGAQYANHDMLVAGFVTASIVLAAHALLAREAGERHAGALALAYACAGCGVMTKGLIGAVLPGIVFAAWCLARGSAGGLRMLAWLPGWALLLAIAAPWMVAMQWRHEQFLHYFFVVQHVSRYVGSGFNNAQAPWFYVAVLAVLGAPWCLWLWRLVDARSLDTGERRRDVRRLMLVWLAVVVAFFSLPRSKLIGYILPAAVPFAVLAAEGWEAAWRATAGGRVRFRPSLQALAMVSGLLCVGVVGGVARFGNSAGRPAIAAWRPLIAAGDRVLMVDRYDYDVPFYLRLAEPVTVATPWSEAEGRDDWRRELLDAASFDRRAGAQRLLEPAELPAWLCRPGTTWVFGGMPALQLLGASDIRAGAHAESLAVWRVAGDDAARRSCLARTTSLRDAEPHL